jgi:mitochondrial import receptor subunit TOM40
LFHFVPFCSFYCRRKGYSKAVEAAMADLLPPLTAAQVDAKTKVDEKVDYSNLPSPVPYEELHREALMSLKSDNFEGLRFDFTRALNQKFSLSHSVMMGPTEVPAQSPETTIKIPTAHYEFGANYYDPKLLLIGRVMTDGRLNARLKADLTDKLVVKANALITNEEHMSQAMFNFDYMGSDYRAQLQLGQSALIGATYIQVSLTCPVLQWKLSRFFCVVK